ncbi:Sulfiredoxin [Allomyces arbusculus]|nr:Sulfiredoxin [Allomyces arbusculus]
MSSTSSAPVDAASASSTAPHDAPAPPAPVTATTTVPAPSSADATATADPDEDLSNSMFTSSTDVYEIPISVIARPIPSVLDPAKVDRFCTLLEDGTDMTPIEVMHLEKTHPVTGESLNYYFAMGGCHRWAAHTRLGRDTIRARIIPVTEDTVRGYLGASLKLKLE